MKPVKSEVKTKEQAGPKVAEKVKEEAQPKAKEDKSAGPSLKPKPSGTLDFSKASVKPKGIPKLETKVEIKREDTQAKEDKPKAAPAKIGPPKRKPTKNIEESNKGKGKEVEKSSGEDAVPAVSKVGYP